MISIFPHNDTDHSAQEEQMSHQKMSSDAVLTHNKDADSDVTSTTATESN